MTRKSVKNFLLKNLKNTTPKLVTCDWPAKSNRGKHYIGSQTDERIVVNNFERVIDLGDIEYGFPGLETPELHSVNNLEVDSSKK